NQAAGQAPGAPPRKLHNLAFGIERMGLVPLRFPYISAIIVLLLSIAAAFGVMRIKVDDSLSQLFRSDTPEFRQFEEVTKRITSNEIIRGKLLSEDGTLTLVVLALQPDIIQTKGLNTTVGEIRKIVADGLKGSELNGTLSGVPVMQLEIRNAVERDRVIYNGV